MAKEQLMHVFLFILMDYSMHIETIRRNGPFGILRGYRSKYLLNYLINFYLNSLYGILTLKAPITTAADDTFCNIFPSLQQK